MPGTAAQTHTKSHRVNSEEDVSTSLSRFRPGNNKDCPKGHLSPTMVIPQSQWFLGSGNEMDSPIHLCPKEWILLPDPESFDSRYSYSFCIEAIVPKKLLLKTGSLRPPSFPEWLNTINCALPLKNGSINTDNAPLNLLKSGEDGCSQR